MGETQMHGEAKIRIEAPPEKVYDLVSDVSRMGEWSPECISAQWVDGATGPAVGAKFKGRNKQGWMKWSTTPEVLTAERGREFAFKTKETTWRYRFDESAGGTDVTETFEVPHYGAFMKLVAPVKKREPLMVQGMQTTLQRIKAAAEGSAV
ncbi:MAG: hypothetical protein QOG64_679 [Acidimicrobiaceae bacterium]|nr:hypothetical protein [Acidimicrobiaceae bacterium]